MNNAVRVLYAEDNPQVALLTHQHLHLCAPEFDVEVVNAGQRCLERLSEEQFDLLLLNHRLPDMDGLNVLRSLAGAEIQVPVVFVTSLGDEALGIVSLTMGAVDYISKRERYLEQLTCRMEKAITLDRIGRLNAQLQIELAERERTAEALKVSETRYRRLFEAARDGILILDAETGRVTDANPFLTEILGYSFEQLIGKFVWELGFLKDIVANQENFLRLQQKQYIRYEDMPLETADGRQIDVEFVSNVYLEGHKKVIQCNIRDITEWKKTQKEKGELTAQLHQAQKMEVVGQLAAGVAHDFNNLLQVMQGYTRMTMQTLEPDSEHYKDLDQVHKATQKAAALTQQLLAIGRQQENQPRQLDLNAVVSDLVKTLQRLIGENVEIKLALDENLGGVCADPGQMEQVFLNLCLNARDAMPEGGRLVIATQNVFLNAEYCATHPWAQEGVYALLTVSDTGSGMPLEVQEHVFEPFFTTKELAGTGLGLATAYGIVRQHGGHIQVYSEVNVGTTFRIYLPTDPAFLKMPPVKIEEFPASGGTETILLADDDPTVRSLMSRMLTGAGYTVLDATNGEEAVETFGQAMDRIDLVMLDVIMPKMNGRLAYEKIKEIKSDTPVIFSSGYSADAMQSDFFASEEVHLLQKPFGVDLLLRTVRQVLSSGNGGH